MKKTTATGTTNRQTAGMVYKIAFLGMLSAISIILVYLLHIPLFPAASFLEYDMADVPIILAAFLFGPTAGLLMTIVVSVVQGLTVSAQSGVIGIFMHIFATGCYVLVAGNLYQRHKTLKGELAALSAGAGSMVVAMILWNLLLTPVFMGAPFEAVLKLMIPAIIPFNLIKAGVNSVIAYFAFKIVQQILKQVRAKA